jgi:hypothetical protein
MKLIKIIIILICATSLCKSQTVLDPPSIINQLDQNMLSTTNNQFPIGWNWGSIGRKLDSALLFNYWHGGFYRPLADVYKDSLKYITGVDGFTCGHMHPGRLNSMAVQFDPAITVDTTSNYQPPSWDNKGAIFGFIKRRGYVVPEDIRAISLDVLRHRIGVTYEAEAENITSEDIITEILNAIEVP